MKRGGGIKEKHAAGGEDLNEGSGYYGPVECETLKNGATACETLKAVIKAIFATSEQLMMSTLNEALKNKEFALHLNDGIVRYLYAAALLGFVGKEINRENLAGVIRSLDIEPNYKFIDIVLTTNIKGHLAYVYAYYYLLVNGMMVSAQRLADTVESLGAKADRRTASAVLEILQQ